MRRAYLDTEFTVLNRHSCKLISLALVVPAGPEFYVELTDVWEEGECSDFVLEIVLPQLNLEDHGFKLEHARAKLLDFLQRLGPIEVVCDAPDWDWPLLTWLAGPTGLPETVLAGRIGSDIDISYEGVEHPHHALLDARLLADMLEGNRA